MGQNNAARGRVLVMDDEEILRLIIGNMLTELQYEAEFAENGEQAIDLLNRARGGGTTFDAVILDLTIRDGMDGVECIRRLIEIDPGIKAIVSSGDADDPSMSNYRSLGFRDVIAKPYHMEDLDRVLHKVIHESDC